MWTPYSTSTPVYWIDAHIEELWVQWTVLPTEDGCCHVDSDGSNLCLLFFFFFFWIAEKHLLCFRCVSSRVESLHLLCFRCVTQDQRSLALGIQWIIARCLGRLWWFTSQLSHYFIPFGSEAGGWECFINHSSLFLLSIAWLSCVYLPAVHSSSHTHNGAHFPTTHTSMHIDREVLPILLLSRGLVKISALNKRGAWGQLLLPLSLNTWAATVSDYWGHQSQGIIHLYPTSDQW